MTVPPAIGAPIPERLVRAYGRRTTQFSAIYGLGAAALLPFGLLSLAVTTRYLDIGDYGRLATLFAIAATLTVVCNLGILQGTIQLVYRTDDDGEDGGDAMSDADGALEAGRREGPDVGIREKRRLLGSGLVLVALAAAVFAAPIAVLAPVLAVALWGDPELTEAIRWTAACVWTGAVWRMVHQVWRLERRPWVWCGYQVLRPLLAVGGTVAAFASGAGLEGALLATAAGTGVACLVSLAASWRFWRFRPRPADAAIIWRRGAPFVGMQVAVLLQTHLAVLLLALLASSSAVGVYAVALRLAAIPSYFADGVLMAWPTIDQSTVGLAMRQHRGRAAHVARVFTLLVLGALGLTVFVSLCGNALIRIFAPGYGAAADLIPLLAAAGLGHSIFRAMYRASKFPRRRTWYIALHFVWLVPFVGLGVALLPLGPTWALAVSGVVAYAVVCVLLEVLQRRGRRPVPFQWGRLAIATAIATGCVLAVELTGQATWPRAALGLGVLAGFPVLLVLTGVVARAQVRTVVDILVGLVPRRRARSREAGRLSALTPQQLAAVDAIARRGLDTRAAALELGVSEPVMHVRLVRGLRTIAGEPYATDHDVEIGRYLTRRGMILERDAVARKLSEVGVDPFDLSRLEFALDRVSAARARRSQRRIQV